jgi:putative flippase GtrA
MIKNKSQKAKFAAVGGINTFIDMGLLFLLKTLGLPAISANLISTSAAFCFSFFANKKYTFKTTNANIKREVFLFVIVTLFGLWGLQTLVIFLVTSSLSDAPLPDNVTLLIAKIWAIITSLIWNYTMYSHVVFKQNKKAN